MDTIGSPLILTTVQITDRDPRSVDVKHLHDLVIQAALAGEQPRPVLWAIPQPRVLIVRHDRPITREDWPRGWAVGITHSPYWWPPTGSLIDGAVVMDAGQSGQSHGQWVRECELVAAGQVPGKTSARTEKRGHTVRPPEAMVEVLTGRLAGILDGLDVTLARAWHLTGRREKEGRVQHSNHTLLRFRGRVCDEPALRALMAEGVGRNKAFGCGLVIARQAVEGPC